MKRIFVLICAVALAACGHPAPDRPRITQFKADPSFIAAGVTGRLCYGVENATRLDLTPAVEKLLPASERCIDISPKLTTVYTLTAYGADGSPEIKSLEVKVGPPPPRVSNLSAKPVRVRRGQAVKVCFKVENARSVTVSPGKLDRRTNCLVDYPKKTTTYRVTARGDDSEADFGTVTVSVLR